jgi:hypothetical protein
MQIVCLEFITVGGERVERGYVSPNKEFVVVGEE